MKIADFLFAFHQSLYVLTLEVVLLAKLQLKGKVADLPQIRVHQSKPANFS